jgi:hypothetical protein
MERKQFYIQRLRDPRWQKRRLDILQRDDFSCQWCHHKNKELVVHHWWYEGEPWEAPDEALMTMCVECHEEEERRWDSEQRLLMTLRKARIQRQSIDDFIDYLKEVPSMDATCGYFFGGILGSYIKEVIDYIDKNARVGE